MLPSRRSHALLALLAGAALCITAWLAYLMATVPTVHPAAAAAERSPEDVARPGEVALEGPAAGPRGLAPEPLGPSTARTPEPREPSQAPLERPPAVLHALVADVDARPFVGASVSVLLPAPFRADPLALATSDVDGRAALELPGLDALHAFERADTRLEVTARAPGFRPARLSVRASELGGRPREVALVLRPAIGLHGRVIDERGATVPGALVGFHALARDRGAPDAQVLFGLGDAAATSAPGRVIGRTVSDAAGNYEFAYEGHREALCVRALHESHGDGGLAHVPVAPDGNRRLPDIVLRPSGVLSGRVLLADGTPANGVEVSARMVARPDGDDAGLSHLLRAPIVADLAGRFAFARLEHGVYELSAGDPDHQRGEFVPAPERRFATGARGIELQADCALLQVRVVTAEGRALRGIPVTCLAVHAAPDGSLEAGRRRQASTGGARPHATFALEPGAQVLLRVTLDGCHRSQRLVALPREGARFDEEVRVHALVARGRLALRVLDPRGQPATDFRLCVFDPFSRRRVGRMHRPAPAAAGQEPTVELPPGPWLLDVRPDSGPLDAAELEPGRGVAVEIEPGVTTRVELRLR